MPLAAIAAIVAISSAAIGCATAEPEGDELTGFASEAITSDAQTMWPTESTAKWTYFDTYDGATKNVTVARGPGYGDVTNLPGLGGPLRVYTSGASMFALAGTSSTKIFDFSEAQGTSRMLPSTLPPGLAGASITLTDRAYSLYDHLNGRNFTECARYTLTPAGTSNGILEIVFADGIGPVHIKTRVAGQIHEWYLKTGATSRGSVVVPNGPTIPPRTDAVLATLPGVSVPPGTTPPWRTNPGWQPPGASLDQAHQQIENEYQQEITADRNVWTTFQASTTAQGLNAGASLEGIVIDPAIMEDLGPMQWSESKWAIESASLPRSWKLPSTWSVPSPTCTPRS